MYHNFIGIDIAKKDFVVSIHRKKKTSTHLNNHTGFDELLNAYPLIKQDTLVVLETTGGYEKELLLYLLSQDIAVHRANTRIVKHFIKSTGQLGKSDNIDAKGLARYGFERHTSLPLYKIADDTLEKLMKLTLRKQDLKKFLVAEKNRFQAPDQAHTKDSNARTMEFLKEEISFIDAQISDTISESEYLIKARDTLVKEVAGLGNATATALLALLPELGKIDRKQIASLSGVAPYPYESGGKIGYRRTYGGRQDIKPILYMSAMAATNSKSKLGEFYHELVKKGKKKMVAIIAVMRKIIVIANAKIRDLRKQLQLG